MRRRTQRQRYPKNKRTEDGQGPIDRRDLIYIGSSEYGRSVTCRMKESDLRYQRLMFVVTFLTLGVVLAGAVWEGKPYLEWTQNEAEAILTDSPWSMRHMIRGGKTRLPQQPREGSGTCVETTIGTMQEGAEQAVEQTAASASALKNASRLYTVRFVSAEPVRKAIARWAILNGRITVEQAQAVLNQNPYGGCVVISISASSDPDWSELNNFSIQDLGQDNYLLLKESRRRIYAERYVPPSESNIGEALFYFSRAAQGKDLIILTEKEVSFCCRVSDRTQFRKDFNLKKMMIGGKLAI